MILEGAAMVVSNENNDKASATALDQSPAFLVALCVEADRVALFALFALLVLIDLKAGDVL